MTAIIRQKIYLMLRVTAVPVVGAFRPRDRRFITAINDVAPMPLVACRQANCFSDVRLSKMR